MSMLHRIWRTVKHSVLLIPNTADKGTAAIPEPSVAFRAFAPEPPRRELPVTPAVTPAYPSPTKSKTGTVERAAEALRMNPAINSTELAAILGVSSSYARRLLRKLREQSPVPTGPVPCGTMPLFPNDNVVNIQDLHQRLMEAEQALEIMRSTPPSLRPEWNLNRRSQVLRCAREGMQPEEIAAELRIPSGEVDFILKVAEIAPADQ